MSSEFGAILIVECGLRNEIIATRDPEIEILTLFWLCENDLSA